MKSNAYSRNPKRRTKAPDRVRFIPTPSVPLSPKRCPLCKAEMGLNINTLFICYSAVGGPYLKGSLILRCEDDECLFRESYQLGGRTRQSIATVWRLALEMVRTLSVQLTPVSVIYRQIGSRPVVTKKTWRKRR